MTIDTGISRKSVEQLAVLYDRREYLQRAKEYAIERNFWLGIAGDSFAGTGTRSTVLEAIGGRGLFADRMSVAIPDLIEAKCREIDQQIIALGGLP